MGDEARTLYWLFVFLMLACATLVYLDWRKQGEIDFLHARVDAIDVRPVARILRATDDAAAEAVAGEGT